VTEIKVAKSVDKALDAEAIRVCKLLPDFYPALENGEPVSVWFTLPITFKL
jgi:protein TonB